MNTKEDRTALVIKAYGILYILYTAYLWFGGLFPLPGIVAVWNTPFLLALGLGIISLGRWAYVAILVLVPLRLLVLAYFVLTWMSNVWEFKTVLNTADIYSSTIATFLVWTIAWSPSTMTWTYWGLPGTTGLMLGSRDFPLLATVEVLVHVAVGVLLIFNKDAKDLFWSKPT